MMQHSPRFLDIVAEARQRVRETDIDTVRRLLDQRASVHLIDVREDARSGRRVTFPVQFTSEKA